MRNWQPGDRVVFRDRHRYYEPIQFRGQVFTVVRQHGETYWSEVELLDPRGLPLNTRYVYRNYLKKAPKPTRPKFKLQVVLEDKTYLSPDSAIKAATELAKKHGLNVQVISA